MDGLSPIASKMFDLAYALACVLPLEFQWVKPLPPSLEVRFPREAKHYRRRYRDLQELLCRVVSLVRDERASLASPEVQETRDDLASLCRKLIRRHKKLAEQAKNE